MRTIKKVRIIFLSLIFSPLVLTGLCRTSYGHYDKTKWGMSLKQVQKIYPNGKPQKQQNGDTMYMSVGTVNRRTNALLMFRFPALKGLESVAILFPQVGTEINLKTGGYTPESTEECDKTFAIVSLALVTKYDTPATMKEKSWGWTTSDQDMIFLTQLQSAGGSSGCTVSVSYQGKNDPSKQTEGL